MSSRPRRNLTQSTCVRGQCRVRGWQSVPVRALICQPRRKCPTLPLSPYCHHQSFLSASKISAFPGLITLYSKTFRSFLRCCLIRTHVISNSQGRMSSGVGTLMLISIKCRPMLFPDSRGQSLLNPPFLFF